MTVAPARPATLPAPPFDPDAIPAALRAGTRFVGYRFEDRGEPKPAKMPYSPKTLKAASSTAPADWATFDMAVRYAQVAGLDGVMRAFDHADGMVGIDLDNCRDPETGELAPWAAEYVRRLDTYTEVSPSETGVKLWVQGTMPAFGHKRGDVEMYGSAAGGVGPCGRFFTMTGRHLEGTPRDVTYRPDAILAIHREVFGDAPEPTAAVERDGPVPALELGDEEVIRLASESPHNGARFRRLWSGDTSDYAADANDGASEADGALCEILAYYGGPDPDRIARLFERSALHRDKWAQRADYRQRTIALALKGKTRFYGDGMAAPAPVGSDGAPGCACEACPAVAEVGRLRRLALDRDDLVEAQQAIVSGERTRREQAEARSGEQAEIIRGIRGILARPNAELDAGAKVVSVALIIEALYRADRPVYEGPNGGVRLSAYALADASGYSPDRAAKLSERICSTRKNPRPGAVFERQVTRSRTVDPDGTERWSSILEFDPRVDSVTAGLRAVATLPADPTKPKHGGSAAASAARWQCRVHPESDVILTTVATCATCGQTCRAPEVRRQNLQLVGSEPDPQPVVVPVLNTLQVEGSDGDELAARRNGHARPTPWRCPECPASMRKVLPDGASRCPRGHISREGTGAIVAHSGTPAPTGLVDGRIAMTRGEDGVMAGYMGPAPGFENRDTELLIRHTCNPTDVIVRRRAGVWTCTNCGSDWSSAS